MPDIDPAALSRPSINLSTPILSTKSITVSAPGSQKTTKTSQIIPTRIDLEPLYTALKSTITSEQWAVYTETLSQFLVGRLNQAEFSERIDPILASPSGEKDNLHNQLIAGIVGNVTREMPDPGLAPFVSANDKPAQGAGSKPTTGDAAERRRKFEVMQLPTRDRRRIKDLIYNDFDPYESLANVFTETHRRPSKLADIPPSAGGGIQNMNFDLEIRKRFAQPLAAESGEFPDSSVAEGRMLPFCYEAGLVSGHTSDAPHFMAIATETFIKEVLSTILSRTRSNGPGEYGSAGFGVGTTWIQTHKYKKQLAREENAFLRGEITRDKSGLLPIEAKAASERGPLDMADMRLAMELGDFGLANFPVIAASITFGYREGELENWDDYTWAPGFEDRATPAASPAVHVSLPLPAINGGAVAVQELPNGHIIPDMMDVDTDEIGWEGAAPEDQTALDALLDSCLAAQ